MQILRINSMLAMKVSRGEEETLYLLCSCLCDLANTGNKIEGRRRKRGLAERARLRRLGQHEEMEPVVSCSYNGVTWRQTGSEKRV